MESLDGGRLMGVGFEGGGWEGGCLLQECAE